MPLINLGFEDVGATPGSADGWTLFITSSAERVALFGTETPAREEERFEAEWSTNEDYLFAFEDVSVVAPLFDTDISEGDPLEDFEEGWDPDGDLLANFGVAFPDPSMEEASFDSALTPETVEDFEEGWDTNEDYDFAMGSAVSAFFDAAISPQGFEDFEDGWRGTGAGNDLETVMGATTAASFDGALAPESVEDFEEVRDEIQVTVDPATDLFTAAALHGFGVADRVSFRLVGAGALPGGVNTLFQYYVLASGLTTTQFRVATTFPGSTIDVTDAGSGAVYITHDRTRYWVIPAT
jgi:hypothetical protein